MNYVEDNFEEYMKSVQIFSFINVLILKNIGKISCLYLTEISKTFYVESKLKVKYISFLY